MPHGTLPSCGTILRTVTWTGRLLLSSRASRLSSSSSFFLSANPFLFTRPRSCVSSLQLPSPRSASTWGMTTTDSASGLHCAGNTSHATYAPSRTRGSTSHETNHIFLQNAKSTSTSWTSQSTWDLRLFSSTLQPATMNSHSLRSCTTREWGGRLIF